MKFCLFLILVSAVVPAATPCAAETLDELIAKVPLVASSEAAMTEEEQQLARDLTKYGTGAADRLVPLLSDGKREVRDLTGFCFCFLPKGSLLPRHFEPLSKACRMERGWLPRPIAGIGGAQAAAFLASEFHRQPQWQGQIDAALISMAPESIEPLLKEFLTAKASEEMFFDDLERMWKSMGKAALPAVQPLLAIAENESAASHHRLRAISSLSAIGPAAGSTFPALNKLAASQPALFAEPVRAAIRNSRTAEAAELLLEDAVACAQAGDLLMGFGAIARCEAVPKEIGDKLAALLADPVPNVRLGAAGVLGWLKRPDLAPQLRPSLKDRDWRVCLSASRSLWLLGANEAIPDLDTLSKTHWYPRVRKAAARITENLRADKQFPAEERGPREELLRYFDHESQDRSAGPATLAQLKKKGLKPSTFERCYWDISAATPSFKRKHPRLYDSILPLSGELWSKYGVVTGIVAHDDQTFVGLTAGEWIGGLFAVPAKGPAAKVRDENIAAVLKWNGRLIALEGLNHMGMDYGSVREVVKEEGKWRARFLYALPGCPYSGAILPDGRLFANCQGGAVAVSPAGEYVYLGNGLEGKQ